MAIITISRQFASEGDAIARNLSKKIGYPLVDKAILERIYYQFGYTDFQEVYDQNSIWTRFDTHHAEMVHLLKRIFVGFAHLDRVVLLGRGGFSTLKGYPNVLNIKVQAPFDVRVERTMRIEGIANRTIAEKIVLEEDQRRREFVEAIHDGKWDDASCFDLIIDSSKVPLEMAVEWIEQAASWMDRAGKKAHLTHEGEPADPVVLQAIRDAMAKKPV